MPERTPNDSPNSLADGRIRPFTTPPILFPKRENPPTAEDIKVLCSQDLLASPDFPRLYADARIALTPLKLGS
jgi:hypothetical protein